MSIFISEDNSRQINVKLGINLDNNDPVSIFCPRCSCKISLENIKEEVRNIIFSEREILIKGIKQAYILNQNLDKLKQIERTEE